MALTIVKSKNTPLPHVETTTVAVAEPDIQKVLVVPPQNDIEALTSEYINLHKKFEYFEVKALVKRMDAIRKQLVAVANETMEADQACRLQQPTGQGVLLRTRQDHLRRRPAPTGAGIAREVWA